MAGLASVWRSPGQWVRRLRTPDAPAVASVGALAAVLLVAGVISAFAVDSGSSKRDVDPPTGIYTRAGNVPVGATTGSSINSGLAGGPPGGGAAGPKQATTTTTPPPPPPSTAPPRPATTTTVRSTTTTTTRRRR